MSKTASAGTLAAPAWLRFTDLRDRLSALGPAFFGMPLADFARRFPSFLRGSIAQTIACYSKPASYLHTGGPSVMLVPGLFCTPSVFNRLGRELESLSIDVHLPRPFPYYRGMLANTGRAEASVKSLLEDLAELHGKVEQITLVGHSLGGIVVLAAMNEARRSKRELPKLGKPILIAPPLAGAPIARPLVGLVPACRDLVPGSPTLQKIAPAMRHVRRTIVSGLDSLVPRPNQLQSAGDHVEMPEFQHMDFYVGTTTQVRRTALAIAEVVVEPARRHSKRAKAAAL